MSTGMIILFQGSRGSGKTLSMVQEALSFYEEEWDIYSNFDLPISKTISDTEILGLDKTSKLKNCVIMIDELQIFFDSRNWKSKNSITFSNFIQQIRKRNVIIMGTTQYVDTVEKRFRQHVDLLFQPCYNEDTQVCSCKVSDLTTLEGDSQFLEYKFYFYAPPIFDLYDTNELI